LRDEIFNEFNSRIKNLRMRRWYKYILNYESNQKFFPKDETYNDHRESMGGYKSDRGYSSKEEFFRVYFYDAHPRIKYYHDYLKQHLKKEEKTLSIGSGRCVNELLLMEDGCDIICSDLAQPCKQETLGIFPKLRFVKHDIISSLFEYKFDCIISLSLFYLFDEKYILNVFKNVAESLKSGGKFIFDIGGAEDNLCSYIIDEFICKYGTRLKKLVQNNIRQKKCVTAKKHHGYRSKNEEIISIAKMAGFTLCDIKCSDYITEISRNSLLSKLPKRIINIIGRPVPYVRMFNFVKNR